MCPPRTSVRYSKATSASWGDTRLRPLCWTGVWRRADGMEWIVCAGEWVGDWGWGFCSWICEFRGYPYSPCSNPNPSLLYLGEGRVPASLQFTWEMLPSFPSFIHPLIRYLPPGQSQTSQNKNPQRAKDGRCAIKKHAAKGRCSGARGGKTG